MELEDFKAREWQDFQELPCYKFLEQEFQERKKILTNDLIIGTGDSSKDDILRGRISELEFKETSVAYFIETLKLREGADKLNKEQEGDSNG